MKQGHCFKVHTRVMSNILANLFTGTIPPPLLYYYCYYCCCYYYYSTTGTTFSNVTPIYLQSGGLFPNIYLKDETTQWNTVSQLHFITIFSRLQMWPQGSLSLCLWPRDGTLGSLSLMSVLYLWTKHITCK